MQPVVALVELDEGQAVGALGHRLHAQVVADLVDVGAQHEQVVGRLDRDEPGARHEQQRRAGEALDRRSHRALELDHRRRVRVARVDGLAVDDQRQLQHALDCLQPLGQRRAGRPTGCWCCSSASCGSRGTTPRPRPGSGRSRAGRAGRRRCRRAMWPPLRSASVPWTTSIRNGISSAGHVGGDPRRRAGAEVVGVGDHRVAEARARAARPACPSAAARRRRRRARAGSIPAPAPAASSPARASRRRAWGSCSA